MQPPPSCAGVKGRGLASLGASSRCMWLPMSNSCKGKHSAPTVKQHLACIRMLFDWLVTGQVMPANPAQSVRGPRHSVSKGSTPVIASEEAPALLDSIAVAKKVRRYGMTRRTRCSSGCAIALSSP